MNSVSEQEEIAVVNNSWDFGGGVDPADGFDYVGSEIAILATPGVNGGRDGLGLPFVFAAGNDRRSVARGGTPLATHGNTFAVSNLEDIGTQFGGTGGSNYGPWISVSAPGKGTFTTNTAEGGCTICGPGPLPDDLPESGACSEVNLPEGMTEFGGTSAAAPVASGVFTMVHAANPGLEGPQIERIIRHTARKINFTDTLAYAPIRGFSDSYGFGLVDAEAAVEAAANAVDDDGYTWPTSPTNVELIDVGGSWAITWDNPLAAIESSGVVIDARGEYSGTVVVRYPGNIWDQHMWSRTATSSGVATDQNELVWTPPDGVPPIDLQDELDPPLDTLITVFTATNFTTSELLVDSNVGDEYTVTYAVFTVNEADHYSVPAVILKIGQKPCLAPQLTAETNFSSEVALVRHDDSPESLHHLPYAISEDLNLVIEADADGDEFAMDEGEFWSLFGDLSSAIPTDDVVFLEMEFDLTDFETASLSLHEVVELWGVGTDGEGKYTQLGELRFTEIDSPGGDPVVSGIQRSALLEHSSITWDPETRNYTWRPQDFKMDDFAGMIVRVRWEITSENFPMGNGLGTPADQIGWWIDRIEMRGNPILPDCSEADFDTSGEVDGDDLAYLLSNWGDCPTPPTTCPADLNGDGVVGPIDQAMLLGVWGECAQPVYGTPRTPATSNQNQTLEFEDGFEPLPTESSLPWIIEELGFNSVYGYMYWVTQLSEEDLWDHILEVIQLLLSPPE